MKGTSRAQTAPISKTVSENRLKWVIFGNTFVGLPQELSLYTRLGLDQELMQQAEPSVTLELGFVRLGWVRLG